jgi:predicted transposase/invertase (TIGR01784 family)
VFQGFIRQEDKKILPIFVERVRNVRKKQFLRMLVRMELDEAKQRLLFGFFETYVKLSDEEERRLRSEVNEMETKEKEQVMELIISYEQKALEKGREEGIKQGMKHLVQTMAKKGMSVEDIANITDLAEEEVRKLLEKK